MPDPRNLPARLMAWWNSLTDEDKQGVLDSAGELGGGIVGGASGLGWLSIPAAGAGAVVGKKFVSEPLGRVMGINKKPTVVDIAMGKGDDSAAKGQVADIGGTFAANAMGEGIGKAVPMAYRAGKAALFSPTAEAAVLQKLADRFGVPLNLAQATGKKWLQSVEIGLDRVPFSVDTIRKFRTQQYKQWENALSKYLDQFTKKEITQEEFTRLAESTLGRLRSGFNKELEGEVTKVGGALHPRPVNSVEAGQAVISGRDANLDKVRQWSDKVYTEIGNEAGDAPVDLTPFLGAARAELAGYPEGELAKFAPPKAMAYLQAAKSGGASTKEFVDTAEGALPMPKEITFREARAMRSELLAQIRRMGPNSNPADARALHALADSLDQSMEQSLGADPIYADAYDKLRAANTQYREFMSKLRPPNAMNKGGNPAARVIQSNTAVPERIPSQVNRDPSMIQGVANASDPSTVQSIGTPMAGPIPAMAGLRRNAFDAAVEGSTITDPATGVSRISPSKLRSMTDQIAPELMGPQMPSVEGLSAPTRVAREGMLYSTPMAKAADAQRPAQLINNAFPPRNPTVAAENLGLFTEAGAQKEAQRGYLENMLNKTRGREMAISNDLVVRPEKLERSMQAAGETLPATIGYGNSRVLGDITSLGRGVVGEGELANPSGTARGNITSHFLGRLAKPWTLPQLVPEAAMYNAVAKAVTSPTIARQLANPANYTPMAMKSLSGAPGAAGQTAIGLTRLIGSGSQQSTDPDVIYMPDAPATKQKPKEEEDPDVIYID